MSQSMAFHKRIAHILKHWPTDAVRPQSVSVQNYLQARLPKSEGGNAETASSPLSESSVNALYSLLDNRYSRRYPLPPSLRYPASDPGHYDAVVREFDEAPSRSWLGRLGKRLGGILKFQ